MTDFRQTLNDPWLYETDYILIEDGNMYLMQPCWCGNFGDDGPDDWCKNELCNPNYETQEFSRTNK